MSRLVVHGCSFTYGQELKSRDNSWPMLLSKYLRYSQLNLSFPGYSNDQILMDMVKVDYQPDDLVIIGWSHYSRWGLRDSKGWFTNVDTNKNDLRAETIKILTATIDDKWMNERWFSQVIYAQEYLKSKGVRWAMLNSLGNVQPYFDDHEKYSKNIDTTHFWGWPFSDFQTNSGTEIAKFGHPNEVAHRQMFELLRDHLKLLYNLTDKKVK